MNAYAVHYGSPYEFSQRKYCKLFKPRRRDFKTEYQMVPFQTKLRAPLCPTIGRCGQLKRHK